MYFKKTKMSADLIVCEKPCHIGLAFNFRVKFQKCHIHCRTGLNDCVNYLIHRGPQRYQIGHLVFSRL